MTGGGWDRVNEGNEGWSLQQYTQHINANVRSDPMSRLSQPLRRLPGVTSSLLPTRHCGVSQR